MLGFEGDEVYRESYYEEEIVSDDGIRLFQDITEHENEDETESSLLPDVAELLARVNSKRPDPSDTTTATTPTTPTPVSPPPTTTEEKVHKWNIPSAPQNIALPSRPPESPDQRQPSSVEIPKAFDQSQNEEVGYDTHFDFDLACACWSYTVVPCCLTCVYRKPLFQVLRNDGKGLRMLLLLLQTRIVLCPKLSMLK